MYPNQYPYSNFSPNGNFGKLNYNPSLIYGQSNVKGVISVKGYDGAMAYPLGANSNIPLFDEDDNILYIKSTDGGGYPSVSMFDISPHVVSSPEPTVDNNDYITRKEFEEWMNQLMEDKNGKSSVSVDESKSDNSKPRSSRTAKS